MARFRHVRREVSSKDDSLEMRLHLGFMSAILLRRLETVPPPTERQRIELEWWQKGVPTRD